MANQLMSVPTCGSGPAPPMAVWAPTGATLAPGRHGHLWQLADGRGLHAPPGGLVQDPETGELCCHFCGRWFRALGSHVRAHGLAAAEYRELVGLGKRRPLTSPSVSSAISTRQKRRYTLSPELRNSFTIGQKLARSGELAALAVPANRQRRAETEVVQRDALDRGRSTNSLRREMRRQKRLAQLGYASIDGYLQDAYAAGASLEILAKFTGLGRAPLRQAMLDAGIVIRPSGANTSEGKRSRARRAEAAAAERVGTDNIRRWLNEQRAKGQTLAQLGVAVDHSAPWVRWRLDSEVPG
jgi:hypothetical protein